MIFIYYEGKKIKSLKCGICSQCWTGWFIDLRYRIHFCDPGLRNAKERL